MKDGDDFWPIGFITVMTFYVGLLSVGWFILYVVIPRLLQFAHDAICANVVCR